MRTRILQYRLILSVVAVLLLGIAAGAQQTEYSEDQRLNMESHVGNMTGHATTGAPIYKRFCIGCHGVLGDGAGENAQWIDPKPRNFTIAIFRCRSTPTGTLPTDTDLYDTVGRGMLNSNMPPWRPLTDEDRVNLVAYVKHFSPRWVTEQPGTPIVIPPEPPVTADRIQAGRVIFQKLECWKCHGVTGRGNGPSAPTLTDDENRPIQPFNFHDSQRFKRGSSDAAMYRDFMTGLDGSPMPSFSDNVKPDEAWDLVMYLRTLQPDNTKEKQIAKQLGLKPIDPNAPLPDSSSPKRLRATSAQCPCESTGAATTRQPFVCASADATCELAQLAAAASEQFWKAMTSRSQGDHSMKVQLKVEGMLALLLLAAIVALTHAPQVSAAATGKITGSVKLDGTAPHMKGIDMSKDPYCAKAHANGPAQLELVVVGKNGGLQNVVLYISQGLSAEAASQKPSTVPVFDQKGCMYTPHVIAMDVGQDYKVTTSDQTAHNIHPEPDPTTGNIPWNRSQPPGAPPIVQNWKAQEVAIPVKCNIHPRMHGYHVVVKGPYAVTDDSGSYTLENVPPGNYTVTSWQETYGTQTQKVTVAAGQSASANFTYKAK